MEVLSNVEQILLLARNSQENAADSTTEEEDQCLIQSVQFPKLYDSPFSPPKKELKHTVTPTIILFH